MRFSARTRVLVCALAASMFALAADPADARRAHKSKHKRAEIAKKEKKQKVELLPQGTLQIVVSIGDQRVTVYDDGKPFAHAPVSTGTSDRPTPMGVFSVIGKERFHRSNLYSNAPMPFMQRLTWSGVAMHAGHLPGYPASHGCIRMPNSFAQKLWRYTKMGARVIVARHDVPPAEISHPKLFVPEVLPVLPTIGKLNAAAKPAKAVQTAQSIDPAKATDAPGPAAEAAGSAGAGTTTEPTPSNASAAAVKHVATETVALAEQVALEPGASQAALSDADLAALKPPEQKVPDGPVAVFISRKTAMLYVRKGRKPMFESTVAIHDPDQPFGTHVFTAMQVTDGGAGMRWSVQTLPPELPRNAERRAKSNNKSGKKSSRRGRKQERERLELAKLPPPPPAREVLDRILMPEHAIKRISKWLTPGASLVVSDHGLGEETGEYTDFIVVTR